MPHEESTYAEDWLAIAERDLSRADRCLRDRVAALFFVENSLDYGDLAHWVKTTGSDFNQMPAS